MEVTRVEVGGSCLPIHVSKKGIRALGVSESFTKGVSQRSVLAGVVMRGDFLIDGFSLATITVGGMDATEKVLGLYNSLEREDINVLLLNGCVIGWYNVVDLNRIHAELMRPLICVTYEESEGLEKYFKEYFPHDWQKRIEVYHQNGPRVPIQLHTNHIILVRFLGIEEDEAKGVLNKFALHGAVPEPLRVARLLARGLARSYANENLQFPL